MPIREYECWHCKTRVEQIEQTPQHAPRCPRCAAVTERVPSVSSFALKGAGWPGKDGKA